MMLWDFIADNWTLIILLVGMGLILRTDAHLEHRMVRRIALVTSLLFLYSVSCYFEGMLGNREVFSPVRPWLVAVNYSLVTLIIVNIIMILFPMQKFWVYTPAVINVIFCFVSIPTEIVFGISEENHFARGPLGFLPYVVNGLYLIYLVSCLFFRRRNQKEDYPILVFILMTAVICLIVPLFLGSANSGWFYLTMAIDVMIYYVFLLQQYTKRDALTKLLNRQSYVADARSLKENVTAVVTMDMNGLKRLNDNNGHTEGDKALKALAECFWKAAKDNQRLYRIGGDEYAALCVGNSEEDVKAFVERIRLEVAKTSYSCSIGYAMRGEESNVETMYREADKMLYEDKRQYYISSGQDRRRKQS